MLLGNPPRPVRRFSIPALASRRLSAHVGPHREAWPQRRPRPHRSRGHAQRERLRLRLHHTAHRRRRPTPARPRPHPFRRSSRVFPVLARLAELNARGAQRNCAAETATKFRGGRPAPIELRERHSSHTVGLVVEYSPATGETRVRFPDGVPSEPFWLLPCCKAFLAATFLHWLCLLCIVNHLFKGLVTRLLFRVGEG